MIARALCALAVALAACSTSIDEVGAFPGSDDGAPPALAIVGPHEEDAATRYGVADDEDRDAPGLQLTLRVDVRDEAIERVDLAIASDDPVSDVVEQDLDGNRAAFFAVTLPYAASSEVRAHAVVDADDVVADATLVTLE